jgi:hypothetical protein
MTECCGELEASNPGRKMGGSLSAVAGDAPFSGLPAYFSNNDLITSGAPLPKIANIGATTRQTNRMAARTAIMAELCIVFLPDNEHSFIFPPSGDGDDSRVVSRGHCQRGAVA